MLSKILICPARILCWSHSNAIVWQIQSFGFVSALATMPFVKIERLAVLTCVRQEGTYPYSLLTIRARKLICHNYVLYKQNVTTLKAAWNYIDPRIALHCYYPLFKSTSISYYDTFGHKIVKCASYCVTLAYRPPLPTINWGLCKLCAIIQI